MTLVTASTHVPYELPEDQGATPRDKDRAFLRALQFTDRSLMAVLDELRRSPRWERTIVIVVGDHSMPNSWQSTNGDELGYPHAGYTWTSMIIASPGVTGGEIRTETCTHVDVAPTLLGLVGLRASNHFMGQDLLSPAYRPAPAMIFRFNGVAFQSGLERWQIRLDDDAFVRGFRLPDMVPESKNPVAAWRHGKKLRADQAPNVERLREAARAWGWIIEENRLMPEIE
jgi:hypothetical protein